MRTEKRLPAVYEFNQEYVCKKPNPKYSFPEIFPPKGIRADEPGAEEFEINYYKQYLATQQLIRIKKAQNREENIKKDESENKLI